MWIQEKIELEETMGIWSVLVRILVEIISNSALNPKSSRAISTEVSQVTHEGRVCQPAFKVSAQWVLSNLSFYPVGRSWGSFTSWDFFFLMP